MNILLLNPPFMPNKGKFSREQRSPAITKSGTFYYPMWLAYATGVLEKDGFNCRLVDAPAKKLNLEQVKKNYLKDFCPDLIVVDTSTPSIYNDVEVASLLKREYGSFVVLVGTHPSALPEETIKLNENIDAVARGEYEKIILNLAKILATGKLDKNNLKKVKGISFRYKNDIIHNPPSELIDDLDSLPFVSKVYLKHLDYKDYFYAHSKYPIVVTITGRGCPHKCIYCVYPQVFNGRKVRYRSIKSVVDEIEFILNNYKDIKEIMFEDDTLTLNKKRCIDFAQEIIRRGLKFEWSANSRADVDLETMKILKKAGLRLFCVGIESGEQKILDNMKKNLKVERIRQFFKDAKRAGILIHGCFLVGNPGETKKTLEKTLKFAKELNPDTAQFFPIMVYPGTEAYKWATENGYLTTNNFKEWLNEDGMHNCIISTPELSNYELVEFCDRARKEFYIRPSYIVSKFKEGITDPGEMKRLVKGGTSLFKAMLKRTVKNKKGEE